MTAPHGEQQAVPSSPHTNSESPDRSVNPAATQSAVTCYRFGSVGQDTLICLWDLTEDFLKKSAAASQKTRVGLGKSDRSGTMSHSNSVTSKDSGLVVTDNSSSNHSSGASSSGSTDTGKASSTSSLTHKLASLGIGNKEGKGEKEHKRTFSLPGRSQGNKDRQKEGAAKSKDSKANKDTTQTNSDTGKTTLQTHLKGDQKVWECGC